MTEQRKPIAIQDLVRVLGCPVRYYFERANEHSESDRYVICKQISYHLGSLLDPEKIWNETLDVRPSIDPALRDFFGTCIAACSKSEWMPAVKTDVAVISEKHGITGILDRTAEDGTFSIVSAAGSMPLGTYATDRLRIAALALCLEEMTDREVAGGYVEYIPDGVSRYHPIQPRDRRQVIATINKTRAIHKGEMPERPLNTPCNRCKYRERCESFGMDRPDELL